LRDLDGAREHDEEDCHQIMPALITQTECESGCRENCEMFEAVSAPVSGLREGGTRITITAAKLQAAIRAALKPCDPLLMDEAVVGMLSDLQPPS
jgi:hypothetical protein